MKKLLLFIAIIALVFTSKAQLPNQIGQGSAGTAWYQKGTTGGDLGIHWRLSFGDTTAANNYQSGILKNIAGLMIRTVDDYWARSNNLQKWNKINGGGSSINVSDSAWMLTGNAIVSGAFMGSTNNQDVVFKRNNVLAMTLATGLVDFTGNIKFPAARDGLTGVIYRGSNKFIHAFAPVGANGDNLFIGDGAGNFTMAGTEINSSYNLGIGSAVLMNNTTGFRNTATGIYAMQNNTTGQGNTVSGHTAMFSNTSGDRNVASGMRALVFNSSGFANVAIGFDALFGNTTADHNTAVGLDALYYSNGSHNTAIGDSTLWGIYNTQKHMGYKNTAIGSRAGYHLGDTYPNFASIFDTAVTFLGANSSRDSSVPYTTSLQNSTAIGANSKIYASNQVSIGNNSITSLLLRGAMNNRNYGSGTNTGTATYNLQVDASGNIIEGGIPLTAWNLTGNSGTTPGTNFVGTTDASLMFKANNVQSGYIDVSLNNTSFGYESLLSNSSGSQNTALGLQAMRSATNTVSNTAVGFRALYSADGATALYNTAIGESALLSSTTGRRNVAVGRRAGANITTGQVNTIVGAYDVSGDQVLSTGSSNTSMGYNTFKFHNGDFNVAMGVAAMSGFSGTQVTSKNTGIGYDALFNEQTGDGNNTSLGYRSGYSTTTGSYNLFLGVEAGYWNTTGSNQIFISTLNRGGYAADTSFSPFYAVQDATATNQRIRLNGRLFLQHIPTAVMDTILYYNPTTDEVTYGLKPAGGGGGTWGSITGTLSDQTDLQAALDAKISTTLADGKFLVGNGSNVATAVTPTGDVTFTNAGVFAIGATKVTNAMLAGSIAYSKLSLTGAILNADLAGSIAYSKLSLTGAILNADLAGSIAYSKLSLTGAILNADLAGSIAYSKLSLTGAILNADLAGSIAYSKLSLTGAILNADLAGSIAASKLVGTDIATVGTITSGTWQGTVIGSTYGGTGINNAGRTLTISTNSGTINFSAASKTLTVPLDASVSGTNTGDQNLFSSIAVSGQTTVTASTTTTALTFVAGSNVTITTDNTTKTITFAASGGGGGLVVGTSTITSGTDTKVLFNNAGVLGEYTISGSGNVAMTTSPTFVTPALGTPSSGTVTNLTGTASININGTVGATTPAAGTFTAAIANSFVPNSSSVPSNGLYLPASNTIGWAINSSAELQLTSTALSPAADGGNSLGTTSLGWQNLFANTGFVLNIENGDWIATHTAGILTVGTGDLRVTTAGTNTASVVTVGGTQTVTNKRITPRTGTTASSGTPTINTDNVDYYSITALAANITSFTTNLSGTPSTGDKLWISITDNGTPRTIAWGASFSGSLLPSTTVASVNLNVGLFWNGSTWYCVAVNDFRWLFLLVLLPTLLFGRRRFNESLNSHFKNARI